MNYAHHRFTPVRGAVLSNTGDAIAAALAKFAKSPQQIENEKRLFRFRAKRELKTFIGSIRDERDLLHRLHCHWLESFSEPPVSVDQAIARLERHYRAQSSHTGTSYAIGNEYANVKQRLFLARFFRRFQHQIWEFGS